VPPVAAPVTPAAGVRASSVGLLADPPAGGGAATGGAGDDALRTRNGLRKRVRTKDQAMPIDAPTPPRGLARPAPAAPVDDSPDMVRSRLTAFRAGIERGQQDQASDSNAGATGASRRDAEHAVEEPE
jgi:hypothetical protein